MSSAAMPTAAKLVAAMLFAALAFYVSAYAKPIINPNRPLEYLAEINALFGAVMGWCFMGVLAGQGMKVACGRGLTTAALVVFWSLLFWAGVVMVERSLRRRYDGPLEALHDMAQLMAQYSGTLQAVPILVFVISGAIVAATLTEMTAQRWR